MRMRQRLFALALLTASLAAPGVAKAEPGLTLVEVRISESSKKENEVNLAPFKSRWKPQKSADDSLSFKDLETWKPVGPGYAVIEGVVNYKIPETVRFNRNSRKDWEASVSVRLTANATWDHSGLGVKRPLSIDEMDSGKSVNLGMLDSGLVSTFAEKYKPLVVERSVKVSVAESATDVKDRVVKLGEINFQGKQLHKVILEAVYHFEENAGSAWVKPPVKRDLAVKPPVKQSLSAKPPVNNPPPVNNNPPTTTPSALDMKGLEESLFRVEGDIWKAWRDREYARRIVTHTGSKTAQKEFADASKKVIELQERRIGLARKFYKEYVAAVRELLAGTAGLQDSLDSAKAWLDKKEKHHKEWKGLTGDKFQGTDHDALKGGGDRTLPREKQEWFLKP